MESLGQRIKKLRINEGLTQAKLGEIAGVHASAVTQWESNKTRPSTTCLTAISNYFKVDLNYLITGLDVNRSFVGNTNSDRLDIHRKIPVLTWQQTIAGLYKQLGDNFHKPGDTDFNLIDVYLESSLDIFAIRVTGYSMASAYGQYSFQPGGYIIVDFQNQLITEDGVFVVAKKGDEIVFRQQFFDGKNSYLQALNSDFPNLQGYKTIGRVIKYIPNELP